MLIADFHPHDDPPQPSGDRRLEEACENLRVIREVMERSIKHSTLSGFSGMLVGAFAIVGAAATRSVLSIRPALSYSTELLCLAAVWLAVVGLSVATDFVITKSRAVRVGKQVFSKLGAQMVRAALPGFVMALTVTLYCAVHGTIAAVWPYWMLGYGIAICSVAQFSVREVSWLGWAFVLAGAAALFLPASDGLALVGVAFGGFHIIYGVFTGITRRDW